MWVFLVIKIILCDKVIAFTVCGSRMNESLHLVKSVLVFTKTPIHFVIFTESELKDHIHKLLVLWRAQTRRQLSFKLLDVMYPESQRDYWMDMMPRCSAQRLFVPDLLPHIDALIYVDTDTLFLGAADEMWHIFVDFGDRGVAALATEHNDASREWAWYPRFAKHPFYGDFGLNTGVMLMNLTRLRAFNWTDQVMTALTAWRQSLHRGVQDIMNIVFSAHPGRVLELSCQYNFRAGVACPAAALGGILLLHGTRGTFHSQDKVFFQAIYQAVDSYQVGSDPLVTFLPALRGTLGNASRHMKNTSSSLFRTLNSAFLQLPIKTLLRIDN